MTRALWLTLEALSTLRENFLLLAVFTRSAWRHVRHPTTQLTVLDAAFPHSVLASIHNSLIIMNAYGVGFFLSAGGSFTEVA